MAYGVIPEGFSRPRLPEIRQEIIADLRSRLRGFGLDDNIETRPDSVFGLLIDTFSERETTLWEMAEGVYYAMYPGSATGSALDRAVSFTGVIRRVAERSEARVVLYGVFGTTVPGGSQIRNKVTQTLWQTIADETITPLAATDVTVVPTPTDSTTYTVTIDGVDYSYTSGLGATLGTVLAGLVSALSTSGVNVSSNGAAIRLIQYSSASMSVSASGPLVFSEIGSSVLAQTIDYLAEPVAIGDLNAIVTRVDGWTAVNNLQTGSVGRLAETDAELRVRYQSGLYRLGAGTLPSISVNIRDRVPGVSAIKVLQNDTDEINEIGDKPHSIHAIVEGGIDTEIAQVIYEVKGGGIDTNGDIVTVLQTSEGQQTIYFDRPDYIYIWVRAVTTLLPANEEPFPSNGLELIKQAINATGQAHGIGQDVITQRFFCGIYADVTGIAEIDLQFASSTDPFFAPTSGDFSPLNIPIEDFEMAKFDLTRIEVT